MTNAYTGHFEALAESFDALWARTEELKAKLESDMEGEEKKDAPNEQFVRLLRSGLRYVAAMQEALDTDVLDGLMDVKRMTFYLDRSSRGRLV